MKKFLAILLAAILGLTCIPALAEDLDLTGVEIEALPAEKLQKTGNEAFQNLLLDTGDVVEVTDEYISVVTNGVQIYFDITAFGGGCICLTQDLLASISSYLLLDDPTAYNEYLIEEGTHLEIMDLFSSIDLYIDFPGSDNLCKIVGTMKDLSESTKKTLANAFGTAMGLDNVTTVDINGLTWLIVHDGLLATIVNGQYVFVFGCPMSENVVVTPENIADTLAYVTFTVVE